MDEEKVKWDKQQTLGVYRNIAEPLLSTLKSAVESEVVELKRKLTNLKRLGVIEISQDELNKKLQEIKFK
jgi:predicted transcriptional regulator